jgi:hypothetical protein
MRLVVSHHFSSLPSVLLTVILCVPTGGRVLAQGVGLLADGISSWTSKHGHNLDGTLSVLVSEFAVDFSSLLLIDLRVARLIYQSTLW